MRFPAVIFVCIGLILCDGDNFDEMEQSILDVFQNVMRLVDPGNETKRPVVNELKGAYREKYDDFRWKKNNPQGSATAENKMGAADYLLYDLKRSTSYSIWKFRMGCNIMVVMYFVFPTWEYAPSTLPGKIAKPRGYIDQGDRG